jgi:hypothetical protein
VSRRLASSWSSCQEHHIGYAVSGHLHIEMTDGASLEILAGDAFEVPPGHDAWVIGDEPHVSIDWAGRRLFAKSPHEDFRSHLHDRRLYGPVWVDRDAERGR